MATSATKTANRKKAPAPKMPEGKNGAKVKGVKGGKTGEKVDLKLPKDKKTEYKVVYRKPEVRLFGGPDYAALSVEDAKMILGYEEEPEGQTWPEGFEMGTTYGKKKFRCLNNPSNRPFRINLAKRYASEIVRGKWKLNGETFVQDYYGHIQQGQHRLVAVILAEELRQTNPEKWATQYGIEDEITIEAILVTGIDPSVADTLDLGQKRTFGDVLYRDPRFTAEDVNRKKLKRLSDDLAIATRLAWIRAGGKKVSDADWFPVSEGLDFIALHPKLVDAVQYIDTIDSLGEGGAIKSYVSRGYAAALLYLMGMAATEPDEYAEEGSGALDDTLWGKAQEFWGLFAGTGKGKLPEGSPITFLKDLLGDMDSASGAGRDEKVATIIKAFNLWMDKKSLKSTKELRIEKKLNDAGKYELTENPRLGGIDVERERPRKSKKEKTDKTGAMDDIPNGTKVEVEDPTGNWTGEIVASLTYGDGKKACEVKADSDGESYEMPRDQVTPLEKQGPGKKNRQPVEDFDRAAQGVRKNKRKWSAGDTGWVNSPDGPYFAEILEVAATGKGGTVKDLSTEEAWDVNFEDMSEVYPEAEDEGVIGQHAKPRVRE